MRLTDLLPLPSFALLGPGFGQGRFVLLRGLRPASRRADAMLVFAPFEGEGARALRLEADAVGPCDVDLPSGEPPAVRVALAASGYAQKVEAIREAIERGDVYQVCLALRAHVSAATGAALLSRMCARGVPRFAAWVRVPAEAFPPTAGRLPGGVELVSASPELFFETDGARVHAEPMKGTASLDGAGQLEGSEKDRAELAMITDLLRNDLAQVCRPKTVHVARERRTVALPYALQTVSDVVGTLAAGTSPLDVLAALHPGGSVTGAPKQAALGLIRALEPTPRGAYCGALGLATVGRSVFSLLIRTAVRTPEGWSFGVGSGIVHDSDARSELAELETKLGILGGPHRDQA